VECSQKAHQECIKSASEIHETFFESERKHWCSCKIALAKRSWEQFSLKVRWRWSQDHPQHPSMKLFSSKVHWHESKARFIYMTES
jgi:hypothetical protein